ncbi:MAG: sugar transferase [Pseudacidovorax sp.]|uniref:sugar transferase n=1 Tax=Pseudacidovorax sp. TaxID=1934311 RepID=UPI001B5070FF|nr:sugar transferase [Pseudacidovorax sp.]MBP6896387.1 sugar transferase [Pseudacidovorax sp.]
MNYESYRISGREESMMTSSEKKVTDFFRRILDISGALFFFFVFGVLFLCVWMLVIISTGKPAIYKHKRVGKNGKEFFCLKFRSMVVNSDQVLKELLERDVEARREWESTFKLKSDPRVTRFGRFIRKTSLDELPQFWNVLKGEMSLVGPRPVVHQELDRQYGDHRAFYIAVRPGLTGLWQISGRSDVTYTERIQLDVQYVKNRSLINDIKILFKTVKVVFVTKGSY